MRISDWSSDVCSSDLRVVEAELALLPKLHQRDAGDGLGHRIDLRDRIAAHRAFRRAVGHARGAEINLAPVLPDQRRGARGTAVGDHRSKRRVDPLLVDLERICGDGLRSEEHTSELQSLMRSSYAVFCL